MKLYHDKNQLTEETSENSPLDNQSSFPTSLQKEPIPGSTNLLDIIPMRSCLTLSEHTGAISSIKLDSHQNRMISGGCDYQLCFWDLPNLKDPPKPFRTLEPHEKQPITQLAFSPDDQKILVSSGGSKPKLLRLKRGWMPAGKPCVTKAMP